MSITELRDKYQKELEVATDAFEVAAGSETLESLLPRLDSKIIMLRKYISDLNALIQSEDKERREAVQTFKWINAGIRKCEKCCFRESSDVCCKIGSCGWGYFESEKGGEG